MHTSTFEPIAARSAPINTEGPVAWVRINLFSDAHTSMATLLIGACLLWLIPTLLDWGLIRAVWEPRFEACRADGAGACWGVITEKYRFIIFGRYPFEEQWRPLVATSLLIGLLVSIWAIRLGKFLYGRIRREGEDRRFRSLMRSFSSFLMTWTLLGLWVSMTLAAGLAAMTSEQSPGLDAFALAGAAIWLIGFAIEVIADQQKKSFRADATNKGKFICSGLWGWSRHPNYVGEIILWTGVAIISLPALSGWQLVTMVSPLFVWILLAHVSGVPMLETQADEKWGGDPDYQAYKSRTARLFPTTFKRIVR